MATTNNMKWQLNSSHGTASLILCSSCLQYESAWTMLCHLQQSKFTSIYLSCNSCRVGEFSCHFCLLLFQDEGLTYNNNTIMRTHFIRWTEKKCFLTWWSEKYVLLFLLSLGKLIDKWDNLSIWMMKTVLCTPHTWLVASTVVVIMVKFTIKPVWSERRICLSYWWADA
jgi:hypothetical protein